MAFKKLVTTKYPPRFWSVSGYPGVGKSTFAARMRGPQLIVDADHRYREVAALAGEVYQLSEQPADNVDADRITALLNQNMREAHIGTIVIDSLTAIIAPLVVQAMADKKNGRSKNLVAGFSTKALAMRQLQDAVTRWGTDVLWLYHTYDALNENAEKQTRASLSVTEVVRLMRSLNLHLEIIKSKDAQRGVKVVWARRGRSGMTLWDETGTWEGMPERIEAEVYNGLSPEEQERIEMSTPEVFTSAELALAWSVEQGAFTEIAHARNAYEKVKRENNPHNARAMTALWVAEVQRRLYNGFDHQINDKTTKAELPPTALHWSDDPFKAQAFFDRVQKLYGLTREATLEKLQVKQLRDYDGAEDDAVETLQHALVLA